MRHIVCQQPESIPGTVREVVACLRAGGVVVAPTETVYGLITRWDNAAGRGRLFALKQRPAEKHLQMLAADLPMAAAFIVGGDARLPALAARFWPGPLTVVVPGRDGGTIGLRLPAHALMQAVLGALGTPLAATSANRSGEAPALCAADAVRGLAGEPDLVVDGGPPPCGGASTVVSICETPMRVIRAGPLSEDALRGALGEAGVE
ncbi:MAG: Threonylcarbamoyl-AMP synthase [Lentisphaerae bacterium ADurb.BinA184]|nr:MAG: Threonylcarbamoyl-AMP synthase [Lentisphaerae bacterium ADurb.BinA184]